MSCEHTTYFLESMYLDGKLMGLSDEDAWEYASKKLEEAE